MIFRQQRSMLRVLKAVLIFFTVRINDPKGLSCKTGCIKGKSNSIMANINNTRLAIFNMHGYNQGVYCLKDLCSLSDVIFIQKHWLPLVASWQPSEPRKFQSVCANFTCFRLQLISHTMGVTIDRGVLRGRPFGGVGIFCSCGGRFVRSFCGNYYRFP